MKHNEHIKLYHLERDRGGKRKNMYVFRCCEGGVWWYGQRGIAEDYGKEENYEVDSRDSRWYIQGDGMW